jgi:hypothetical protein
MVDGRNFVVKDRCEVSRLASQPPLQIFLNEPKLATDPHTRNFGMPVKGAFVTFRNAAASSIVKMVMRADSSMISRDTSVRGHRA